MYPCHRPQETVAYRLARPRAVSKVGPPPHATAIHGARYARGAPWLWRLVRSPPRPLGPRRKYSSHRPDPRMARVVRLGHGHVRPRSSAGSGTAVPLHVLACAPIGLPQIGSLLPARVCVHGHGICDPVAFCAPACCERVPACGVTPVSGTSLCHLSGPHNTARESYITKTTPRSLPQRSAGASAKLNERSICD